MNQELERKVEGAVNLEYLAQVIDGKEWRRPIRSSDMLMLFGTGGKTGSGPIPKDYEWGRWIGDTFVRIQKASDIGHPDNHVKVNRRVIAMCNRCGTWVCAGHLTQHVGTATCSATKVRMGV